MVRPGGGTTRHRHERDGLIDPLDEIIRIEGGQVLATLIRLTGDIDRAEDALHDAVVVAADAWRRDGVPDKPGAWLTTVARNKELDRSGAKPGEHRRKPRRSATSPREQASSTTSTTATTACGCCSPAATPHCRPESQVALALRTICGLTTVDIARVFLVPEATIGQRISRAKAKIAKARIPYRVPDAHELPDRLRPVLATVYAVFTAGHHAPVGELGGRRRPWPTRQSAWPGCWSS